MHLNARVTLGLVAAACTLASCAAGVAGNADYVLETSPTTGAVYFRLDLPNGEQIDLLRLGLSCPDVGVAQEHVVNVEGGEAVASFGGLAPGMCSITITASTSDGSECTGVASFTIVADTVIEVPVAIVCMGVNELSGGSVVINATLSSHSCIDDRIRKIYVHPANILLGESTRVDVELHDENIVGTPDIDLVVLNNGGGQGDLSLTTCPPTVADCRALVCVGGESQFVDPETNLPTARIIVAVTVEDDECRDTETVGIYCSWAD
jgi:hypothetical protein